VSAPVEVVVETSETPIEAIDKKPAAASMMRVVVMSGTSSLRVNSRPEETWYPKTRCQANGTATGTLRAVA
jgi:hypothetical protein